MGYRGKLREREQARRLRARGHTLNEICRQLNVSKSSVSVWVRDVEFTPRLPFGNRNHGARNRQPNALQRRKQDEIERSDEEGRRRIRQLSHREFLVAGAALYAAEGSKTDGAVAFANTDHRMISFFCSWLRRFFAVDESRLRLKLYLHEGLDLDAAKTFWSELTGIPTSQFGKPYRAVPDAGIRNSKHLLGCATVTYSCSRTHRQIMGLCRALLTSAVIPG